MLSATSYPSGQTGCTPRRALARERAAFEAERDEQLEEQTHTEQRERRTTEAEVYASDLGHDMDANRPGYVAGLIIAAAVKARGLGAEPVSGLAADIVRIGEGPARRGRCRRSAST